MTPDQALMFGIPGLSICFSLMYLLYRMDKKPNIGDVK